MSATELMGPRAAIALSGLMEALHAMLCFLNQPSFLGADQLFQLLLNRVIRGQLQAIDFSSSDAQRVVRPFKTVS